MSTPGAFPATFLYRQCHDGSLATVVRRKPHTLVSSGSLTLMRPQLPGLEEVDNAETPLQNDRKLKFAFPYRRVNQEEVSERSGRVYVRRQEEKSKADDSQSGNLSLRDVTEGIVEHLELSRNHPDVVQRRRDTRESPLQLKPFSFSTQSVSQFPVTMTHSLCQQRAKRQTLELKKHAEALTSLGFDDENSAVALRLRKLLMAGRRRKRVETEPCADSPHLNTNSLRRAPQPDEASQFLQDAFKQKLGKDYFGQLRFTRDLRRKPVEMRTYRGLELV